mgnify:CR=1 FL=1
MRFKSQKVAYYFFATCMLLLSLQIVYGFIMAFAHMGYDVLHNQLAGGLVAHRIHGRGVLHHSRGIGP